MPNFLYSANDASGKSVKGFVDGLGSRQTFDALQARGLSEIKLHEEAALAQHGAELVGLTPEQAAELARLHLDALRKPGLLPLLATTARLNRVWLLAAAVLLLYGLYMASMQTMVVAVLAAVFPFAWASWQYRHGYHYHQLSKSFSVGDWPRVKTLAAKLRGRAKTLPMMGFDLDIRLACIAARQGQLIEALASVEHWRTTPELLDAPGMFECRQAEIYAAVGDRSGFVAAMGQGYEVSRHDPSRTLDYALAHARWGDADQAEVLFASTDLPLLPPHAAGFVSWTAGLIELRRGLPQATATLGVAVAEFLKMANQPAVWTPLAFCTLDHAIALNLGGQQGEARRELAQVWPIVKAHADQPLLKLLKADGLLPDPGAA